MMLGAVALAAALAEPRFFIMGNGTLGLESAHGAGRATVTYRHADGTYDRDALATIRRVMRSSDGSEGDVSLRLVELLGWLYAERGKQTLTIQSGYRSPDYNEAIRANGARAAGGSLHTEGLAADVALPAKELKPLWMRIRARECCGAGYYRTNGFLHLDVGRPRFWEPATSKVEQNLSAGNALVFARTEYDRYAEGEAIAVTLHAVTAPPIRVAKEASLVEGATGRPVRVVASLPETDGCLEVAERGTHLHVEGVPVTSRAKIVFKTCGPKVERTPDTLESNAIEVLAGK
jgi:uncharacterized protein YcbK (DUF882 family)